MLASWPNCPPLPELLTHESWGLVGLEEYREVWLAAALAPQPGGGNSPPREKRGGAFSLRSRQNGESLK
jgi:hypothetical protein